MAVYTVTTTPLQEAALTRARLDANALPLPAPQYADNAAFVAAKVGTVLKPIVDAFVANRINLLVDAYRSASFADRQQVDTVLGLPGV